MSVESFFSYFRIIRARRQKLKSYFNVAEQMAVLEESCVPSYTHGFFLSAHSAWLRLFAVSRIWDRLGSKGPVLDFGCGTGEIYHLLKEKPVYHFIEVNSLLAKAVEEFIPLAERKQLEEVEKGHYGAIFAMDSLEHNDNVEWLLIRLFSLLQPNGVLILTGPTENFVYRFGRWVSGFRGEYHKTNIYDIENIAAKHAHKIHHQRVPLGFPLFNISCWQLKNNDS